MIPNPDDRSEFKSALDPPCPLKLEEGE